jgi:DNA-directed RNA polymerase subunit F
MALEKPQAQSVVPVRTVTLAEVKALLEREQEGRQDLNYEQKLALDHATHFVRLTPEKAQDLADKLLKLGGRVSDYYAYRIADLLPTHADDVRAIFARERSVPVAEEIEKVLSIVREFL